MKKTWLAVVAGALGLWAAQARAINLKTQEVIGAEQFYHARVSAASSHTVTGLLLGWSVTSIGGATDFQVKHSTTIMGDSTSALNVNQSSTIYVLAGQSLNRGAGGLVVNPLIYITRIDQPGTTAYVDILYLKPRAVDAGEW